jgi:ankyrin repeat protein
MAEPTLFYALEHPRLVRLLLELGADVNQTNHFGKTALMYAAQFNLPKTANLLLSFGANPNLLTVQKSLKLCGTGFKRIGRSALMYAAENADTLMISALINAGAETKIRDVLAKPYGNSYQPGLRIPDYLAHNKSISRTERRAIIGRWEFE